MKNIDIKTPDGRTITLTAPDNATPDMIQQKAMQAKAMYVSQNSQAGAQKQKGPGFMDTVTQQVQQGLGPIGLAGQAQGIIQEMANRGGNLVATNLAQNGVQMAPGTGVKPLPVDPRIAAAAGTVAQMTPDILQSVMPGEVANEAAPDIVKALKAPGKARVLAQTADSIQNDLNQLTMKQTQFPRLQIQNRIQALQAKKEAGVVIGALEKKAGIGFDGPVDVPEGFLSTAKKLASMSPKDLAENVDITELQKMHKIADTMLPSANKYEKLLLSKTKAIITDAQDILAPGIKEARDQFGQAAEVVKQIPDQFKMAKSSLAEQIKRKKIALSDVKQQLKKIAERNNTIKKVAGSVGLGGAAGLGYKIFH